MFDRAAEHNTVPNWHVAWYQRSPFFADAISLLGNTPRLGCEVAVGNLDP